MTSLTRAKALWKTCKHAVRNGVPGDFVGCGVWKGGSAGIMALAARGSTKIVHLYDSFEGLPEPSELDGPEARQYSGFASQGRFRSIQKCVGLLSEVQNLMKNKLKIRAKGVEYHVEWFQKTYELMAP